LDTEADREKHEIADHFYCGECERTFSALKDIKQVRRSHPRANMNTSLPPGPIYSSTMYLLTLTWAPSISGPTSTAATSPAAPSAPRRTTTSAPSQSTSRLAAALWRWA
jgi:hypothetical protein